MKLYVINLDRSPERLQRLQGIFKDMGLNFERVRAVDGQTLDDGRIQQMSQKVLWKEPLTRGEIACFLSHKKALHAIADGRDAYGAVFEDDVSFSHHASDFLKSSDWIPSDGDIIKIETHGKKTWLGKSYVLDGQFSVAELKSRHIMAAAYIVSKPAARELVRLMEYATAPFDHWLFNPQYGIFEQFKIYQLDPAIAVQAGLQSTLEKDRSKLEKTKKANRSVSFKLAREIKRLISRSKIGLWGLSINLFTHDKWKRVKFDD